jgi:hypothetical protein
MLQKYVIHKKKKKRVLSTYIYLAISIWNKYSYFTKRRAVDQIRIPRLPVIANVNDIQ